MSHPESRRPLIAVLGDARLPEGDPREQFALDCGRAIIDAGFRLVTGGLGGIMEAASRGAHQSDRYQPGDVIGLLPGTDPNLANSYVDITVATGFALGRNIILANADAVIAIGGGPGTMSEVALAWQLQRLVIGYRCEGWSGKLADERLDLRRDRYPDIRDDRVYGVDSAAEAVDLLTTLLPKYVKRLKEV